MNLDPSVADGPGGVAAVHLGDGYGNRRVRRIFLQRPTGVIHRRTGTLGFQVHIRTLMLDGLKYSNWFPKLFSSFGIFDRHIERSLHATDQFGGQSSSGDVEGAREIQVGAEFFRWSIAEFNRIKPTRKVHSRHRSYLQAASL